MGDQEATLDPFVNYELRNFYDPPQQSLQAYLELYYIQSNT